MTTESPTERYPHESDPEIAAALDDLRDSDFVYKLNELYLLTKAPQPSDPAERKIVADGVLAVAESMSLPDDTHPEIVRRVEYIMDLLIESATDAKEGRRHLIPEPFPVMYDNIEYLALFVAGGKDPIPADADPVDSDGADSSSD